MGGLTRTPLSNGKIYGRSKLLQHATTSGFRDGEEYSLRNNIQNIFSLEYALILHSANFMYKSKKSFLNRFVHVFLL